MRTFLVEGLDDFTEEVAQQLAVRHTGKHLVLVADSSLTAHDYYFQWNDQWCL